MKKLYNKPCIEIDAFDFETIMSVSGGTIDQGHGELSAKQDEMYDTDGNYLGE